MPYSCGLFVLRISQSDLKPGCFVLQRLTVRVSNFGPTVTDNDLAELFSDYGTVTSSLLIARRSDGVSLGYALVPFSRAEDATQAARATNDMVWKGSQLRVDGPPEEPEGGEGGSSPAATGKSRCVIA